MSALADQWAADAQEAVVETPQPFDVPLPEKKQVLRTL
jgi:hypothetical protein